MSYRQLQGFKDACLRKSISQKLLDDRHDEIVVFLNQDQGLP